MKKLFLALSVAGFILTLLAPLLAFGGTIDHDAVKHIMMAGMILWFAGTVPKARAGRTKSAERDIGG